MCLDRRHFLKAGLGVACLAVPGHNMLALGAPRKRPGGATGQSEKLVVVNIRGGWDSLSLLVPHGLNEYYNRRPTLAVPAPDPTDPNAALPAENGVGFSPLAPELHAAYQLGEVAVAQKAGYPEASLSHFSSQDIMSKGIRDFSHPDNRGWLGRLGDLYFTQSIKIVGMGTGNKLDFVGDTSQPVILDDLDSLTIPIDSGQAFDSPHRNDVAEMILNQTGPLTGTKAAIASSTRSAFQLADLVQTAVSTYPSTIAYPNSDFAYSLKDVARMIWGNLGSQVFYVETGGFDTHSTQASTLNDLLPRVSQGLGAFIADLKAMSQFDATTICVISEFGRRNYENGSQGTDHGHGVHFFCIGGGIQGGLKGANVTEAEMQENYLSMQFDFRHIYSEILQEHLNLDPTPVFPDWTHPGTSIGLF